MYQLSIVDLIAGVFFEQNDQKCAEREKRQKEYMEWPFQFMKLADAETGVDKITSARLYRQLFEKMDKKLATYILLRHSKPGSVVSL